MRLFYLFPRKKPAPPPMTWERTPTVPQVYLDEDGRRHRGDAPYLLPKDEKEIRRLDYQHFILRQVLKGNTFAPVHQLLRKHSHVLDVGCGTGRWGCEMAAAYPQAQVVGFDLEDIPRTVSTPLNYQFYRGNLLNGLPFPAQQFHYVHQRLLVAAIPLDKWPWVIGELRRVTCPDGWVELVEMGNTFHHAGPATKQFLAWWVAISASKGIDASKMSQISQLLKQGNFSHIRTKTEMLPVGAWGGRLGNLLAQDILAGWPSMRPLAHTLLQVPPEQFDAVIGQLATEWDAYRTSYEVYFSYGQV
jgi:ubiquinone/menaquinone biosynthesis C-methylase UbiE